MEMSNQSRIDIKSIGGKFSDNGITLPYLRHLADGSIVPAIFVIGVHTNHDELDARYSALHKPDSVQYWKAGQWDEQRIRSISSMGLINPISVVRISVPQDDEDWPEFARGTNQFAVVAGRHRCIDGAIAARRAFDSGAVSRVDAVQARVLIDWRYEAPAAAAKSVDENLHVRRLSPLEVAVMIIEKESQGLALDEIVKMLPNPISTAHARQLKAIYNDGCEELHQRIYEGSIKISIAMDLARKTRDEQRRILPTIGANASAAESKAAVASASGKKFCKPPTPKEWRKALANAEHANLTLRERMLVQLMGGQVALNECTEEIRAMFSSPSTGTGAASKGNAKGKVTGKGADAEPCKFAVDDVVYFRTRDGVVCSGTVAKVSKREINLDGAPKGYTRWMARNPYSLYGNQDIVLCQNPLPPAEGE